MCSSKLATVHDFNLLACLPTLAAFALDLLDNVHALGNVSENNVLVVQPVGLDCAEEKLNDRHRHRHRHKHRSTAQEWCE